MNRCEAVPHHPLTEFTRFGFRTVAFGSRHDDWIRAGKGLEPSLPPDDFAVVQGVADLVALLPDEIGWWISKRMKSRPPNWSRR